MPTAGKLLPGKLYANHRLLKFLLVWSTTMLPGPSNAGAYIFAGEGNGIDVIAHPNTYTGSGGGGVINVRVCIADISPNAFAMENPVQNIVNTFNGMRPTNGNLVKGVANNIPSGHFDFESVALHEVGHCLGMAHVNAATESGLSGNERNYTKATDGANNGFDRDDGADNVIGSSDDLRGDDVNLHWFRKSNNNPFTIDAIVDSTTYSIDTTNLPAGTFAANGDRNVANLLLGTPDTEAVMQQGTFSDESQRTLIHDDVATLQYAASGIDETAGNGDDYTINMIYGGISSTDCDINLSFDNNETDFAVCKAGGTFLTANHIRITTADIYFNENFNWFYNGLFVDTDGDGIDDTTETAIGANPNNVDSDGDGLVDGPDGRISVAALPGGIDSDNDGFVDGEQGLGTDPTLADTDTDKIPDGMEVFLGSDPLDAASWPNIADGDLAPLGNPDGSINAADLLIALRIVLGDVSPLPLQFAHGDLYPDGSPDDIIDLSDVLLLEQLILGPP